MTDYNGWTNYETWAVGLWINNEQWTQENALELARSAREGIDFSPTYLNKAEKAKYDLANTLKDWVEDEILPDLGATLAADLLGAAVSEVNWDELAESFLSDESERS